MTPEQILQLYAMLLVTGGLVIVATRMYLAGGGTANRALAVAVESQSQVASIVKWQMEFIQNQAANGGRMSERLLVLQEMLEEERKSSLALQNKIIKSETDNKAALDKMRYDSDKQIASLTKQIEELQAQMADIQKKLDDTVKEKEQLERQKDEAQKAVEDLQKRVGEISVEMEGIRKDMVTMRDGYEAQIKDLQNQITLKDEEIARLKKKLEGESNQ